MCVTVAVSVNVTFLHVSDEPVYIIFTETFLTIFLLQLPSTAHTLHPLYALRGFLKVFLLTSDLPCRVMSFLKTYFRPNKIFYNFDIRCDHKTRIQCAAQYLYWNYINRWSTFCKKTTREQKLQKVLSIRHGTFKYYSSTIKFSLFPSYVIRWSLVRGKRTRCSCCFLGVDKHFTSGGVWLVRCKVFVIIVCTKYYFLIYVWYSGVKQLRTKMH